MGNLLKLFSCAKNNEMKNDVAGDEDDEFVEIFLPDEKDCQLVSNNIDSNDHCLKESVADRLSKVDQKCKHLILEWKNKQLQLQSRLVLNEPDNFVQNLNYIGGVDISFPSNKDDLVHACACFVVMSYPELKIVYKICKIVHLTSVYIPEYLAFREVEPIKTLCEELKANRPELYPHLILVDGNGILHPRKFGLACHLGVVLDTATVGVAKKLFQVDGLERNEEFKIKISALQNKGCNFDLIGTSGAILGKALRSTDKSCNPIYISIGHKVCLETALDIVNKTCLVRVPEPVRWADILSREYIRENYEDHMEQCNDFVDMNNYFLTLSKLY